MPSPPNILFILTDNQRSDLLGCAGNPIIHTPNLDALAERGVRFSNAFATTPICAASRASCLTGLYERRHQFTFLTPPLRKEFSDITYPRLLKSAGYHAGFIGKFGVARDGIEPSLEDGNALDKMFDHFDNYEHWTDEGYEIRQPDGSTRHLTDITGDRAVEYLEQRDDSDQPFCLSISFNAPHAQVDDPRHYVWPELESNLYQDAAVPQTLTPHSLSHFLISSSSPKAENAGTNDLIPPRTISVTSKDSTEWSRASIETSVASGKRSNACRCRKTRSSYSRQITECIMENAA